MGGHKKLIIGNWKMHFTVKQAVSFAEKLAAKKVPEGVVVAVAPHTLALAKVAQALGKSEIDVAAQNAYYQDEGAFTGEISMPMLRGLANYVLVGHSERRHIFHEADDVIRLKMAAAMRSGLTPVLCIGETLYEKQHYHTKHVLHEQLTTGLADLTSEEISEVVIAYEPVWAISHGTDFKSHQLPTPEDAQAAMLLVRKTIASLYGAKVGQEVRVIYGGSASADMALGFLGIDGIDGLLPGGASLSLHTFWPIVEKAAKAVPKKIEVKK